MSPIKDCITGSPFCPINKYEEFQDPVLKAPNCDSCVKEGLEHDELPRCFFHKVDTEKHHERSDFSIHAFAEKVMELKKRAK